MTSVENLEKITHLHEFYYILYCMYINDDSLFALTFTYSSNDEWWSNNTIAEKERKRWGE